MRLLDSTTFTLAQLNDLLSIMNNEAYAQAIPICGGSSIGMHVRHILELYQCLLRDYPLGMVNYDNRVRNQLMETNIDYAESIIGEILKQLHQLPEDQPLVVVENQSEEEASTSVKSTLKREVVYNLEHCIHHMAIIAICIRSQFPYIVLDPNFGKAYSTIRFERSKSCVQ